MAAITSRIYSNRPSAKDGTLGPLIRMYPIHISELPAHPDFPSIAAEDSRPDTVQFFTDILNEGERFAVSYLPTFEKKGSLRESEPSHGKVQVYAKDIDVVLPKLANGAGGGLSTENWFSRISQHENAIKDGTASFEEMDGGLRKDHAVHEKEYTPDLIDAHLVLDYGAQLSNHSNSFGEWQDVHAEMREMVHHLPAPLNKRCFSVMVVTARKAKEFLTVQLPVNFREIPNAKYAQDGKITEGIYVSVEHGTLIDNDSKTEWRMGTASDAKGVLPLYVQKMALPGAVTKDVGLFMKWRIEQRKGKTEL